MSVVGIQRAKPSTSLTETVLRCSSHKFIGCHFCVLTRRGATAAPLRSQVLLCTSANVAVIAAIEVSPIRKHCQGFCISWSFTLPLPNGHSYIVSFVFERAASQRKKKPFAYIRSTHIGREKQESKRCCEMGLQSIDRPGLN